jgi:hypothetical protein
MSAAKLPIALSTLYAELLDLSEDDSVLGYESGSYTSKEVKGKRYWYLEARRGSDRVQKYIGPETPELLAEIDSRKRRAKDRRADLRRRREICRALTTTVGRVMDRTTANILKALSDAGAFSAGAILIGTQAYGVYAAMLGRKFREGYARTGDVDFAAIQIAIEQPVSFAEVIAAAEENMVIVPASPFSRITTKLKMRGSDYRVELLTPQKGDSEKPVVIENLKFGAQPLRYLDYLIEDPIDAVAPADVGIRVKVPTPERYALHKLIVAQIRDRAQFAKREKDLAQAQELIGVLKEDLADDLATAWRDLVLRGTTYTSKAEASLKQLEMSPKDLLGGD